MSACGQRSSYKLAGRIEEDGIWDWDAGCGKVHREKEEGRERNRTITLIIHVRRRGGRETMNGPVANISTVSWTHHRTGEGRNVSRTRVNRVVLLIFSHDLCFYRRLCFYTMENLVDAGGRRKRRRRREEEDGGGR